MKTADNVYNKTEIEHSMNLNLTKTKDNNTTKIDNITTEINKKVMNSPKKKKNRRNNRI